MTNKLGQMNDKLGQAAEMALNALKNKTAFIWDHGVIEATEVLEEALTQALAEPNMGIDRGAWSDVPSATKWVDELRGGDDSEESPNSPTDVVEPVAWMEIKSSNGLNEVSVWQEPVSDKSIPLYTAPPKREWVELTDEEIAQAVGSPIDEVYLADFRKVEAKLRSKNG